MIKAEWTNKDALDLQPTCNKLATNAEPKTGKRIQDDDYICDQCGYHMTVGGGAYNFCPNCGARMTPYKGGDDE